MTGTGRHILNCWAGLTLLFLTAPFVFVAWASLGVDQVVVFPPRGLTLHWYGDIPAAYIRSFGLSIGLAAAAAVASIVVAIPAALGIVRAKSPGMGFLQALVRAPLQVPQIVIGVAFLQFYSMIENATGWRVNQTFTGLLIAHLCLTVPYSISAVSAALAKADPHLEEAAFSLGASRWSSFRRVLMPQLKSGVNAALFFAFITSFENVPISLFLVGRGVTTLPLLIFQDVQFAFGPRILALSTLVVIFSTALILTVQRFTGLLGGPEADRP